LDDMSWAAVKTWGSETQNSARLKIVAVLVNVLVESGQLIAIEEGILSQFYYDMAVEHTWRRRETQK
jgi:hypothetical protein